MALYRLNKSKNLLSQHYRTFILRKNRLSDAEQKEFKRLALETQEAIYTSDREKADFFVRQLEIFCKDHLKMPPFFRFLENFFKISFALLIAVIIRQTAFEPYEIPSGSMRPTYKEKDRLVVSKTQFGVNIPLTINHFLFKPEQVKRMGVVVFTGEGMDIQNVKTRYFYLFPGYRQYIKRMIGLPGDHLYFYGGKIFGIDKEGNDITPDLQLKNLSSLEHIPYMYLEGKATTPKMPVKDVYSPTILHQMNQPIVKLSLDANREIQTEFLMKPNTSNRAELEKFDLYKLWGMENFATARILKKSLFSKNLSELSHTSEFNDYYLELTHHQSAAHPTISRDAYYRTRPCVTVEKSYIPLLESDLKTIWNHIYTGRFVVENGKMHRYGMSSKEAANHSFLPKLGTEVPNGTYEFQEGKLYTVNSQGVTQMVDQDHPLAKFSPMRLFILFNAGIDCDTRLLPLYHDQTILPSRYAYFRNGDLYLMGAKIFDKGSDTLHHYLENENQKTTRNPHYLPFIDRGPPLKQDGTIDSEVIKTYGLRIPEHHYFVLGDNHAMSGDSRDFGFVPESNIRGVPSFLFWAPGGRFGLPNGSIYPFLTIPRIFVWISLLLGYLIYTMIHKKLFSLPLRFEKSLSNTT